MFRSIVRYARTRRPKRIYPLRRRRTENKNSDDENALKGHADISLVYRLSGVLRF